MRVKCDTFRIYQFFELHLRCDSQHFSKIWRIYDYDEDYLILWRHEIRAKENFEYQIFHFFTRKVTPPNKYAPIALSFSEDWFPEKYHVVYGIQIILK